MTVADKSNTGKSSARAEKTGSTQLRNSSDSAETDTTSQRRRKGPRGSPGSSLKSVDASGRDTRDTEQGDREADRASNTGWGLGDEARMGLG
jgi:hypothetical protein